MKKYTWGLFTSIIFLLFNFLGCRGHHEAGNQNGRMPNIVIIYLDDLGYGDMGAYGSTVLKTPQMDFLANNGLRFTDGYASSATCTPSRYALLTGIYNNSIVNGIPRIGFMRGGKTAQWKDEEMADIFLEKAQNFVVEQNQKPFFLYYAMQQPHVPRTPHPRFVGKSGLGPRGDVIMEADWCIGEFMKTLEKEGLLENTLIILTSDNGPVLNDGYEDDAVEKSENHSPAGPLRGGKYSLFEAGTRVPFITFWKNKIQPGISTALVSQIDLLSSLAALVGSETQTQDSENLLGSFMGTDNTGRKSLIIEATSRTALRKGKWIMIPPYDGPALNKQVNIELGNSKEFQLFNLEEDIGQKNNLAQVQTDKLKEMIDYFEMIRGEEYEATEKLELQ